MNEKKVILNLYKTLIASFEKEYGVASVNVLKYSRLGLQYQVEYYLGVEFAYLCVIHSLQECYDDLFKRCAND